MAASLPLVYIRTFERTVQQLAQQGENRLRAWCCERSAQSAAHNWEVLNAGTAVSKAAGRVATPNTDTQFGRRVSVPLTYHTADFVQPEDIAQTLISPASALAESHAMAIRRAQDTEIITRALGTALDGAGASNAFLAGQQVGAYANEITFDLITQVTELFMANDVDPDEPKCFVIAPKQARKLLQLTEASSADFNSMRPLQDKGYVQSWMGYTWILSNRLPLTSTDRDCFAMTKKAMGFQVAKEMWSRAEEDPSNSFDYVVYSASTYGAIRVQDKHLVQVKCKDTVA